MARLKHISETVSVSLKFVCVGGVGGRRDTIGQHCLLLCTPLLA
jgi:thiamine pyrophosphokinase